MKKNENYCRAPGQSCGLALHPLWKIAQDRRELALPKRIGRNIAVLNGVYTAMQSC